MYEKFDALIHAEQLRRVFKFLLMMKFSLVFLLFSFQVHALTFAQKVDIKVNNASIKEVFYQLTEQTGRNFIADAHLVKQLKPINLNLKNASLNDVLMRCFGEQSIDILIKEEYNTVVIRERKRTEAPIAVQQITISGKITNEQNEPLQGVSVKVKGQQFATISDEKGNYQIHVPDRNVRLTFTYIGYQGQEKALTSSNTLHVVLLPEIAELDEIVVVGYGQ